MGKLEPLKAQLLDAISRDEDITELKREYQEISRFGEYVKFLRDGKKSAWWKEMYKKSEVGPLSEGDISNIRSQMR